MQDKERAGLNGIHLCEQLSKFFVRSTASLAFTEILELFLCGGLSDHVIRFRVWGSTDLNSQPQNSSMSFTVFIHNIKIAVHKSGFSV